MKNYTFYLVLIFTLHTSAIKGQDESPYNLQKNSDLYDEYGYLKSKAISVSGKLSVSNSNGNLNYTYPLASYTKDGYPININLNYVSNLQYTAFESCAMNETPPAWTFITSNKPTWMISVNNFVVQAMVQNNEYFINQRIKNELPLEPTIDSLTINQWTIDGYDYGNKRARIKYKHYEGNTQRENSLVDVIKILRADGSMLELIKANIEDNFSPDSVLFTGKYVERGINSTGMALVYLDDDMMSEDLHNYLRDKFNNSIPHRFIPRVVRYFPGDGLEYVFVENKFPFGVGYLENLHRTAFGCNDGGFEGIQEYHHPSSFYLREIRSDFRNLVSLRYAYHKTGKLDAYYEIPADLSENIKRGRAPITSIDGHPITMSSSGLSFDYHGKKTTIKLISTRPQIPSFTLGEGSIDNPASYENNRSLLSTNASAHLMVEKIIDPEDRVYQFIY